ncbi:MAG: nucleoside kinase [Tissierellaceae bacterium]|nr:nucleoside kinase [Tissierellaceae bacterium]
MKLTVFVEGVGEISIKEGSTLKDLSEVAFQKDYKSYLGARIKNEVFNLNKVIENHMYIKFLDISDKDGYRIYTKTISSVFIMACRELFPERVVRIQHFLGEGLYVEFEKEYSISFKEIEKIEEKMKEIILENYPITREKMPKDEAIKLFEEYKYEDKIRLFNSLDREDVHVYTIGGHKDTYHGFLAPTTGYVDIFQLRYYYPGVLILFPSEKSNYQLPKFKELKKLSKVFKETGKWGDILDLAYVGSLNEKIKNNEIPEIIRVSEALHEKKIANIADKICEDDEIHLVLIAGPSSSGKTTFSKRLAVQLKVNGKRPASISVDDYFVNRDKTPLNPDGTFDFETIDAIDLEKLNEDLLVLLEGGEIELPKFDFIKGERERSGKIIKVDKGHPIILEGIHSLNPKMTSLIPEKNKYKIYISALTQLNIDAHNRIPTTDTRLIRRIVRDIKYRGNDAISTLDMWDRVRAGEEKYIFPFQEEADIMFDSALVYELAVLKKYIKPLLEEIDSSSIHFGEAKKLLKFLQYFRDIENEDYIPSNSILREFIGKTYFDIH